MQTVYARVAGLDVHHKFLKCAVRCEQENRELFAEVRHFETMTRDLLAMADYLEQLGVTHVALESTGVLWKPIWNILEGRFELLLVNPTQVKQVPGRKRDITDAEWIAQLLQCGLLRGSFVPQRWQRELRDLTRHRAQLEGERNRAINRIHKTLEDANIKLGAVASDILGKSGREMLAALLRGERNPQQLADLAKGKLRDKRVDLMLALDGKFTEHHHFMLQSLLKHLEYLDQEIDEFSQRIAQCLRPKCDEHKQQRLDAVPGVNQTTIENVVAEIGIDMSVFPNEHHISSWAGISPANEESAGKRLRSRTTKKNRWLRRALTQAAWAASRTKNSYFAAQYRRLAPRRGKKRALVAVAHSILVILYHLLANDNLDYKDLGKDYFDKREPERVRRYLVKRLESLGFQVTLTKAEQAA